MKNNTDRFSEINDDPVFQTTFDQVMYSESESDSENESESTMLNSSDENDIEKTEINLYQNAVIMYAAKLSNLKIPRKFINNIIDKTNNFLQEITKLLKQNINVQLNANNTENNDSIFSDFANCLTCVN